MTTPEFPEEQPAPDTPSNLADWGTRAIGLLIDALPFFALYVITLIISQISSTLGFLLNLLVGILAFLYFYVYLGQLDGTTGQTPGKAVVGIRVVNAQGELVGSGTGIARKFSHIIDGIVCGLGWLLPLIDAKRQTIADKVVNTYVVTGVEKKPFSLDLYLPRSTETT